MLSRFENLLEPTEVVPSEPPTADLDRFYWHFARQARWLIVALFFTGLLVAALDTTIPVFIGRVVSLISTVKPDMLFALAGWQLLGMAGVLLIARPLTLLLQSSPTKSLIPA
jgi:ATP-binding cassette subfamily B multidrug efflux pump